MVEELGVILVEVVVLVVVGMVLVAPIQVGESALT